MNVYRSFRTIDAPRGGTLVSIGLFDGVHLGHRMILGDLVREAETAGGVPAVITFDPHPRAFLDPEHPPRLLTTVEEKIAILSSIGVEHLFVIPFDSALASTAAEDFVRRYLVDTLAIRRLIVGYDFRLGRGREGGQTLLCELGARFGFDSTFVGPRESGGKPVKSTWIRDEIEAGNVAQAALLLERFYSLSGEVRSGAGRGKDLGAPTANLDLAGSPKLWPAFGVYAVFAETEGKILPGVANVGVKPTFGTNAPAIEIHLFGYRGDLVGKSLRVHFVDRIREERRFETPADLARQIAADVRRGKDLLEKSDRKYLFTAVSGFDNVTRERERTPDEHQG